MSWLLVILHAIDSHLGTYISDELEHSHIVKSLILYSYSISSYGILILRYHKIIYQCGISLDMCKTCEGSPCLCV